MKTSALRLLLVFLKSVVFIYITCPFFLGVVIFIESSVVDGASEYKFWSRRSRSSSRPSNTTIEPFGLKKLLLKDYLIIGEGGGFFLLLGISR